MFSYKTTTISSIVIILFIVSSFTFETNNSFEYSSKKVVNELIQWEHNQKLTWKDFKGKPNKRSPYKAMTYASISSNLISFSKNELKIEVLCHFVKNKSWKKTETDELLRHEQLHFDIAELAARKMRERVSKLNFKSLNTKNLEQKLNTIFNLSVEEQVKMNQKYDSETNHSIKYKAQLNWENWIKEKLIETKEFSRTNITIN
jgi:hypothetical protein